jgi:hypothetical protein
MRTPWVYFRLHNSSGLVIGFMRQIADRRQYAGLMDDRWQAQEIPHADRVKLPGPLPGFRYLKDCKND